MEAGRGGRREVAARWHVPRGDPFRQGLFALSLIRGLDIACDYAAGDGMEVDFGPTGNFNFDKIPKLLRTIL